jgi:hypothetical protein
MSYEMAIICGGIEEDEKNNKIERRKREMIECVEST